MNIKKILNYLREEHLKLIFLLQISLISYLLFGVGILTIVVGDTPVESVFWINSGALTICLMIIVFRYLNYECKLARALLIFLDLLFLILGILMIFFCLGTELWIPTILGVFFTALSLISMRTICSPALRKSLPSEESRKMVSDLGKKIAAMIILQFIMHSSTKRVF